jgi:Ras-related protein Rab-2A
VRAHADPHLSCILVGNKVDLCEEDGRARQVPTEEAARWAEEEGLLFVEASAKSGRNVEQAFEQASKDILSKIRRGVFDDDRVRESFFLGLVLMRTYRSHLV